MSIIKKLEEKRVVQFHLCTDTNTIEVREMCDEWYYFDLTKDEMGQLIIELRELYDKMP